MGKNLQLRRWQARLQSDDVVAEWKMIKDEKSLHVHCYVSGANIFQDLAAEFRYHIFSKELPLVSFFLKTMLTPSGILNKNRKNDSLVFLNFRFSKLSFMEILLSSKSTPSSWNRLSGFTSIRSQRSTIAWNAGVRSRMRWR